MTRTTIALTTVLTGFAAIALGGYAGYAMAQQQRPHAAAYAYATKGLV